MGFISYAQNFEDVILRRALQEVDKGFYVDVGACDPDFLSVTKTFYMEGWSGINIEPIEREFSKLCKLRPKDKNLNIVAGSAPGEVTIWQTETAGLASTNKKAIEKLIQEGWEGKAVQVKCSTLNEICGKYAEEQIHFMKIDVEGSEKDVLLGLDLTKYRPWIILLEALEPLTLIPNHQKWEDILLSNNYSFVYFDGLNRFYLADEHIDLQTAFELPPNVFDDFIHYATHDAQVKLAQVTHDAEVKLAQVTHDAEVKLAQCKITVEENSHRCEMDVEELRRLKKKIKKMRRSFSWKLTYPFRFVRRGLRKIFKSAVKILRKLYKLKFPKKKITKWFRNIALRVQEIYKIFIYFLGGLRNPRSIIDLLNKPDLPISGHGTIYYYVNHTALHSANTGIQRVTRILARSLMNSGVKLIPVMWSSKKGAFYSANFSEKIGLSEWNGPYPCQWSKWVPLEKAESQDWLFVPELANHDTQKIRNIAKSVGIKCAWIFYDAIPWKRPDIYTEQGAKIHKEFMFAINDCDRIFAISKFSHDDMIRYYDEWKLVSLNLEKRLSVASLPGEFLESERKTRSVDRAKSGEIKILCVGTIDRRKNQLSLVRAVKRLYKEYKISVKLTLAGISYDKDLAREVENSLSGLPGCKWMNKVDDEKLKCLYEDCDFTVFPSIEEGFGLPILESLWNAKPCICANFGSMYEVSLGGGCLTVDVTDVDQICEAIKKLIENRELLDKLTLEATSRDFKTWDEYADEISSSLFDCMVGCNEDRATAL